MLPSRPAARSIRLALQWWDRETAGRPDVLVANSEMVRERIRRLRGREAEVIHLPVDVDEIAASDEDYGYLLVLARLLAWISEDALYDALGFHAPTRPTKEYVALAD